jgi:hypothetical protein
MGLAAMVQNFQNSISTISFGIFSVSKGGQGTNTLSRFIHYVTGNVTFMPNLTWNRISEIFEKKTQDRFKSGQGRTISTDQNSSFFSIELYYIDHSDLLILS